MSMEDIDAIGVTYGPGLIGSLLVGVEAAKTLSFIYNKPLIPVHHIAGHIYANRLVSDFKFPLLSVVVSGGHTELVLMKDHYNFEVLGHTLDDAIGECYDKVARVIGLTYPGGAKLDKLAHIGKHTYDLPVPLKDDSYNFAVESIINKVEKALNDFKVNQVLLAGGVAANSSLRDSLKLLTREKNLDLVVPPIEYCTDNAAMIGSAAYYAYKRGDITDLKLN